MKRFLFIFAAVVVLGSLVSTVQAQSLIGTWQGTLSYVALGSDHSGFGSGTASLHVTNQVSGLFMGYFVPPGGDTPGSDTNSVVGIVQASIMSPGSYDVTLSISDPDSRGGTATGQLTLTTPPKIWRIVYTRPGADAGPQPTESVTAGGKLTRTSVTP